MKILKFTLLLVFIIGFMACVPTSKFTDTQKKAEQLEDRNRLLRDENRKLTVDNNELEGRIETLTKRFAEIEKNAEALKKRADDLEYTNSRLRNNESELQRQIDALRDGSSEEITNLLSELQILQRDLQEREDRVRRAEDMLNEQENKLLAATQELERKERILEEQQARLMELQDALDKQKDAVSELRDKLNHALRGFYDQGLSVHEKNGKVYVSLEENLMFRTGSYNVDPGGQQALRSLSEVLAANPEISIMVEGHTDDVPLSGTGVIKDNWDLSVMRATAVTKIILENKGVDPKRLIAAGRSEYIPLEETKTPEARRKNRRTEIILTPDLSEVLEIIQSH